MSVAARHCSRGLSLVELIVALTVSAVVASFSIALIAAPPAALDAGARRSSLRDAAQLAIDRIESDWRDALPNSLRARNAAGRLAIEHLAVLDTATLFQDLPAVPAAQRLSIGAADAQFETLGSFRRIAKPLDSTQVRVALHHSGAPGANAWQQIDVISTVGSRVQVDSGAAAGQDRVNLTPAAVFTAVGAARRVYLLSGPVTLLCDPVAGTLTRYSGYAMSANQALRDSDAELTAAGAARALLATGVTACRLGSTVSVSAAQTVRNLSVTFRDGPNQLQMSARGADQHAG
jgi:MSHA biogenesis protein MshO